MVIKHNKANEMEFGGRGSARKSRAAVAIVMASLALAGLGASPSVAADQALEAHVRDLEVRLRAQEDKSAIEKLTRAYGYYVDKQLWDQIVPLFTDDARIEIAGRGVYNGRVGADAIFRKVMGGGQIGLRSGALFNHMILQGIVDVDPGGKTASGRWRAFVQIAKYKQAAIWSEGTYENRYRKVGETWQISEMHFYATYYTPFDKGWKEAALPNNGPSADVPPDAQQSVQYDVFPGHYVPPFHYPNPVSGERWTADKSRQFSTKGEATTAPTGGSDNSSTGQTAGDAGRPPVKPR